MKKFYTFFAIACVIFVGKAQVVTIPDVNFKAALLQADSNSDSASAQTPVYDSTLGVWRVTTYNAVDINGDGEIQVTEAQAIKYLDLYGSNIADLTGIEAFVNLQCLSFQFNQLTTINPSVLPNLRFLNCTQNQLTSLDVSANINLHTLRCTGNQLTTLTILGLQDLNFLYCEQNQLSSVNLSELTNLKALFCDSNQLSNLSLSNNISLQTLFCQSNQLTNLNVSGLTNLKFISCSNNQLANLDVSGLINLQKLYCTNNQLTSIDISSNGLLTELGCSTNQLTTLFIKNNNYQYNWGILDILNNPNLTYICSDEADFTYVQNKINSAGYASTCTVNSYCSFIPNGTFYTFQGQTRLDGNSNGCDINDINIPSQRFTVSGGAFSGTFISNTSGSYLIPTIAGNHTITPIFENTGYFIASPSSTTINFPATTSPFTQNFCVTANGTHNDLEAVLLPIGPGRPGFDATYKIIYRNKGTTMQSGEVALAFNDSNSDFISAAPVISSQATNSLSWSFTNLMPFETREITVILNINSPTESPAVFNGDLLSYTCTITGAIDETPNNNTFYLNQTAVGSYDPNDKTCAEGTSISPSMIGEYMHYIIRFENTGTANAENIVVKDVIDTTKFDITTLIPLSSSAASTTRIANTNQVEFIFANINLPFDDANNDGYIAFKIKTKPTLVVGNTFSNTANIYFDYNFPITTNTYTTTIQILGNQDFEFNSVFTLSPVPAKDIVIITTKQDVIMSSANIYNTLGQLVHVITNPSETIDVSGLKAGSYFIKIISDKGTASSKFIKE